MLFKIGRQLKGFVPIRTLAELQMSNGVAHTHHREYASQTLRP
jgi:hypothetical protein